MLEPAVIVLRLIQYAGAMILFGSSLFAVYALPSAGPTSAASAGWPKRLLITGAMALLAGTLVGLAAQTSILAGSILEGLKLSSLSAVVTTMAMGPSSLVRAGAAALALAFLITLRPSRGLWLACAAMGAVACASFAWMGHGAATQGSGQLLHLTADILHAVAAAVWIGALTAFLLMAQQRAIKVDGGAQATLHKALQGFAGVGSAAVAILIVSGLINSWFLVGPTHLAGLWATPYGRLLALKLVLFAAMLGLAAVNRFQLTPSLGQGFAGLAESEGTILKLRRSVWLETITAFLVLALVAWLGTLAPVSA